MEVDDVDRRVLGALLTDARADATALAAAAGVGEATATWRRQVLEDAGVIRSYDPEVDYDALGYDVTVLFRVETRPQDRSEAAASLADVAGVESVYEVAGTHDVLAFGRFSAESAVDRVRERLAGTGGVRTVQADRTRVVAAYRPLPVAPDTDEGE